jgi:hypothetical protein
MLKIEFVVSIHWEIFDVEIQKTDGGAKANE